MGQAACGERHSQRLLPQPLPRALARRRAARRPPAPALRALAGRGALGASVSHQV